LSHITELKKKINDVVEIDKLTEQDIWESHSSIIWKAKSFEGNPSFYPVYKWQDYYSYSVLALILKKNILSLNEKAKEFIENKELSIIPNNLTIDKDITRIGKAHEFIYSIDCVDLYCQQIASALIKDIALIEDKHPEYLNIVMCGGKDSLNLLLLPWKNPLLALSAEPNYELVCEFVKQNNLNVTVEKLEDLYDEDMLQDEIAEACCRADLSHWRWGIHLRKIVAKHSKRVVIWKGQLGDVYMAPTWKTYIYPKQIHIQFICKVYKRSSMFFPKFVNKRIGRLIQPAVIRSTWDKSANLQGSHVGFIRALADCLVLSSYHGENVLKVFSKAELGLVAQKDIRPHIGEILLGRKVIYPKSNPAPKESAFREGKNSSEHFLNVLMKEGVIAR
jgi:hypothetical protein